MCVCRETESPGSEAGLYSHRRNPVCSLQDVPRCVCVCLSVCVSHHVQCVTSAERWNVNTTRSLISNRNVLVCQSTMSQSAVLFQSDVTEEYEKQNLREVVLRLRMCGRFVKRVKPKQRQISNPRELTGTVRTTQEPQQLVSLSMCWPPAAITPDHHIISETSRKYSSHQTNISSFKQCLYDWEVASANSTDNWLII